jgi:hypothetical protein
MAVLAGVLTQAVACDTLATAGAEEPAEWAGESGLSYDPETGWYNIVWKTSKDWGGMCRALMIELIDGTQHAFYFDFR